METEKGETKEDFENEEEIKENCEIKINNIIIRFSYYHKFNKEGKYIIQYLFKKKLSKINHMFYRCSSITYIDLSHFNTQSVKKMWEIFFKCYSLKNINLSNINTQNVTNMGYIFSDCSSLTTINLFNSNNQNATDMHTMFWEFLKEYKFV